MVSLRLGGLSLLLLFLAFGHCFPWTDEDYSSLFEAQIVREPQWTFAILHPNQTLEARCTAKGNPTPHVYFLNEYIDFDYQPDDVQYAYSQINSTLVDTRMVITDPAYAAYMPMIICETENAIGFHDNIYMSVTRL